jgi:hypothetical protein
MSYETRQHRVYSLYREYPPRPGAQERHAVTYWLGFHGQPFPEAYLPASSAWWAYKAGQENAACGQVAREQERRMAG